MKTSKLGKALGLLTALVLSTAGLTVMSAAPASAVPALTGASLRLINYTGVDVTQSATDQGWAQYYNAGLKFEKLERPRGSETTLTYEVKNQDGNALSGAAVNLRVAKQYSGSNANLSWTTQLPATGAAGHSVSAGTASTKDQQATIAGVTDADGLVSFTFANTDTTGGFYPSPVGATQVDKLYTQVAPEVVGLADMDQAYDLSTINFTKPEPTSATLRLSGLAINAQNSYDATQSATDGGWAQYYNPGLKFLKKQLAVGTTINMQYLVKDQDGDAITNHAVQLRLAKQYSGSNAALSVSSGESAAVTGKSDQFVVDGISDANGQVTFSVQNTDNTGGALPVAPDVAPVDTLFTQTAPYLVGMADMDQAYDLVNLNYTSEPVVDPCVADPTLPQCVVAGPTAATLRLVGIDETNSYDGTHYAAEQGWAQYYNAGLAWKKVQADLDSITTLDYLVLDQDGNPLANKEVQLRVAKNYSGSNAHVSVSNGIDAPSEATGQQIVVLGMTSETGHVIFAVNGLDTSGAGARVAPTAEAADTLYTQIAPLLVGLDEMAQGFDLLNINYVAGDIASSDATLSALTVNGSSVATDGSAVVHVAAGTSSVAVVATTTDANAAAVVTGDTGLVAGDNTVTVAVTAQDGTTKASFTVKVVVDPVVAPAVKIAISSTKGKVSVKFTNAKGKTVRVYISGNKSVTKKITSNSQTLSFSVKKGKKTVSVSVAGKNFTKSVTVK